MGKFELPMMSLKNNILIKIILTNDVTYDVVINSIQSFEKLVW